MNFPAAQAVSAASLPLPTGAATSANQTAIQTTIGSNVPLSAAYLGANSAGNLTGVIQASASFQAAPTTAMTTLLVSAVSGQSIYVTGYDLSTSSAATSNGGYQLEYGTGSTCASPVALTPAYVFAAGAGVARPGGLGPQLIVPAGDALCLLTSQAQPVFAAGSYTQF
jgi:hypothetical protein